MSMTFAYLIFAMVIHSNALNLNLATESIFSDTNLLQSENAIDSQINPLDYLFNHSSELHQIYTMFDLLLLNSKSDYEYNIPQYNTTLAIGDTSMLIPYRPPKICVTSHADLLKMWNEIGNNNNSNTHNINSITIGPATTCSDLDKIKTDILIMKQNFIGMTQKETSSKEYNDLKVNYEMQMKKLHNQLDNAQPIASTIEKMSLDEMLKDLKIQKTQISSILRKMEGERRILNDAYIRLCIADLERENIASAVEAYSNITEKSQIRRIIHAIYEKKEQNFKIIFEFVKQTNDQESLLLGYSSLFEHMKTNQHMNVMNLLLLTNAIINYRDIDEFKNLYNLVNEPVKVMHRNNDYEAFYNFMYNKSDETSDFAKDMMVTFVKGAYNGDAGNVGKVLNMTTKLNVMRHRMHLINSLISEMKLHGHSFRNEIFMVLFKVAQMRLVTNEGTDENDKLLANIIEQNLPDYIRDLLFTNLCIQNANNNEYLYSGQPSDESRRHTLTSTINKFDDTFDFEIEFLNNGKNVLIKNSHYREHLYITENGSPRKLLSWMPAYLTDNTEAYFSLEIVDASFFRIKSDHYGEYLYSPSNEKHDENSRRVYFRREDKIRPDSTWKIQTCRHRVRYE